MSDSSEQHPKDITGFDTALQQAALKLDDLAETVGAGNDHNNKRRTVGAQRLRETAAAMSDFVGKFGTEVEARDALVNAEPLPVAGAQSEYAVLLNFIRFETNPANFFADSFVKRVEDKLS